MKVQVLVCIALQLSFIYAIPKSINQIAEYSVGETLTNGITPNENTLIEIGFLKDFYPYANRHVIRKRNVGEPSGDPAAADGSQRRRRRRRRKQIPNETPAPESRDSRGRTSRGPSSSDPLVRPPLDNILDPSEGRRSRRRRPSARESARESAPVLPPITTPAPSPALVEEPILSEAGRDDPNGLLKAKELEAKHIQTDQLSANRLKADRIKADKVKAKDVIVTAGRSSRRRRPKLQEFIQPGPAYERTGLQSLNALTDNPTAEPNLFGLSGQETNTFGLLGQDNFFAPTPTSALPFETAGSNVRDIQHEQLFAVERKRPQQFVREEPGFGKQRSTGQTNEPFPEFISSKIIKGQAPKLSEFIAEAPKYQSEFIRPAKYSGPILRRQKQYDPSTEFHLFDTPIVSNRRAEGASEFHDRTSKTYVSKTDPWYLR